MIYIIRQNVQFLTINLALKYVKVLMLSEIGTKGLVLKLLQRNKNKEIFNYYEAFFLFASLLLFDQVTKT